MFISASRCESSSLNTKRELFFLLALPQTKYAMTCSQGPEKAIPSDRREQVSAALWFHILHPVMSTHGASCQLEACWLLFWLLYDPPDLGTQHHNWKNSEQEYVFVNLFVVSVLSPATQRKKRIRYTLRSISLFYHPQETPERFVCSLISSCRFFESPFDMSVIQTSPTVLTIVWLAYYAPCSICSVSNDVSNIKDYVHTIAILVCCGKWMKKVFKTMRLWCLYR